MLCGPAFILMLNVTGCNPDAVHIGMKVRIAFEHRGDGDARVHLPVAVALQP